MKRTYMYNDGTHAVRAYVKAIRTTQNHVSVRVSKVIDQGAV